MEKDEYSQITFKPQKKRSSFKNMITFATPSQVERRKSCSIQWTNEIKDPETVIKKTKTMDKKLKDLHTIFPKKSGDEDDLYLNKLATINQITPTKEVIEEIAEMLKEKDIKSDPQRKGKSDEIIIPKEIKIKSDEELDAELMEETMKNTLINRVVGKLEE